MLYAEDEHHERRAGANDKRVDVDGEALHESLLHGMRHVGGGRRVGCRSHARFVREEPSLDTPHDHRPGKSTGERREVKRLAKDKSERSGDIAQIGDACPDGNENVRPRHDGNDPGGDDRDAMYAAEDHDGHDDEQANDGVDDGLMALDNVIVDSRGHVVGLQSVETEAKAEDEGHRKDDTEPALAERKLNVVRRPAAKRAVGIAHLPDLGKRGLDERRSRTNNGHEPHPEDRTRTADGDGRRDADDVARAHARCRRDHERLERRDPTLLLGFRDVGVGSAPVFVCRTGCLGKLARVHGIRNVIGKLRIGGDAFAHEIREHVLDVANLDETRTYGEPHARRDKQDHQDVRVHEIIDGSREGNQKIVKLSHGVSPLPLMRIIASHYIRNQITWQNALG